VSNGPCPRCGTPLVRQTDRRMVAGYSLRCSRGGHARPGGGANGEPLKRQPRTGPPRGPRARGRAITAGGTQEWLTDPGVAVCRTDGCFWDAARCPVHR
jgi:hypothetical protein